MTAPITPAQLDELERIHGHYQDETCLAVMRLVASLRAAWARIETLERERDTLRARIEVADE